VIRSATLSDLREVASWVRTQRDAELWAGWRVAFPLDPGLLPSQVEFTDTNAFCLVADDRVVAFGQLVAKSSRRGHLARVIVSPEERQQGYGRMLVEHLLAVARARGLERVSLNVDDANEAAIALYSGLGFTEAARPPDEPQAAGVRYLERTM
jgi:[ribosomal protein S18]-alanine N-acetyltransferase